MNKKGMAGTALYVIFFFAIFAVITVFSWVLIQQVGEEYVISIVADTGRNISNETYANAELTKGTITTLQNQYNGFSLAYDLFFLFLWLFAISVSIFSVFAAKKQGIFSFFGFIFIGSILILLLTSYLAGFTDWFMAEIFDRVFSDLSLSLPIFNFYLANLAIINFIWWCMLVGLSVIDRQFISRSGAVEE